MKASVKQTIKTNNAYFMTATVIGWVDIFTRKNYRDIIIRSLEYCKREKGLVVFAYVIMSNHIHLIASTNEPFLVKGVMRDFKKFTSKKILFHIENEPESRREWMLSLFAIGAAGNSKPKNFKFWQEGNHAIELYSEKFVWEKINYIHSNPVRSGLVKEPENWIYSSARNYYGLDNIFEVDCIKQRLITY